jgi:hypothetical protein
VQGPDRRGGRLEPEDQGDRQDGHGGRPHDVGRDHREAPVHRTDESSLATIEAFQAELREAGPGSVRTFARFMLHLSEEELRELDRRLSPSSTSTSRPTTSASTGLPSAASWSSTTSPIPPPGGASGDGPGP